MKDCLIVSYDNCAPGLPTLIVGRRDKYDMTMLNKIRGDEAFGMYCYLTGYAELKDKPIETNADKLRSMNDEALAEFLMSRWFIDDVCKKCEGEYDKCGINKFCESKILEWLQKKI